jgi:hypothetical protein
LARLKAITYNMSRNWRRERGIAVRACYDTEWAGHFEALRAYLAAGNAFPSARARHVRANGSVWKIGNWIGRQRRLFRQGKILAERAAALDATPGWTWTAEPWHENYDSLREYFAAGHGMPTQRETWTRPDGSVWGAGRWVSIQLLMRRKGLLAPDRAALLEAVPGWDWHGGAAWARNLKALRECALTAQPNALPGPLPNALPNALPSTLPSTLPNALPSTLPSTLPIALPSTLPNPLPGTVPSTLPGAVPIALPSTLPIALPIALPSTLPSTLPSPLPATQSSALPAAGGAWRAGAWIRQQKRRLAAGKLSEEKARALDEAVGAAWRA